MGPDRQHQHCLQHFKTKCRVKPLRLFISHKVFGLGTGNREWWDQDSGLTIWLGPTDYFLQRAKHNIRDSSWGRWLTLTQNYASIPHILLSSQHRTVLTLIRYDGKVSLKCPPDRSNCRNILLMTFCQVCCWAWPGPRCGPPTTAPTSCPRRASPARTRSPAATMPTLRLPVSSSMCAFKSPSWK